MGDVSQIPTPHGAKVVKQKERTEELLAGTPGWPRPAPGRIRGALHSSAAGMGEIRAGKAPSHCRPAEERGRKLAWAESHLAKEA